MAPMVIPAASANMASKATVIFATPVSVILEGSVENQFPVKCIRGQRPGDFPGRQALAAAEPPARRLKGVFDATLLA